MADSELPLEVRVLFASEDLLVRYVGRGGTPLCYVTFDSYTDSRTLDRRGFGEDFLRARGIDAIHVINRENLWYQHEELPAALAAVAAATQGYRIIIAYGSSMGGYAALRYGRACGASVGLAISPQYSIDPQIVPFEDRWPFDADRIRYRNDECAPLPLQYIVYDPRDAQDRAHYALFEQQSPTIGIPVPYSGHPAGGYLHETRMFEPLFEGIHAGALDLPAFTRELRTRRHLSGQYFFTLSRRMSSRRLDLKVALARLAAAAVPGSAIYQSNLAACLDEAGADHEASAAHRDALALMPDFFHVMHSFVLHLERIGDLGQARTLAEQLVRDHPSVLPLRLTRRRIRRRQRRQTRIGQLAQWLRLDDAIDYIWERAADERLRTPATGNGASGHAVGHGGCVGQAADVRSKTS